MPIPPKERPLKARKKYSPGYLASWANRLLRSYAAVTPQMRIDSLENAISVKKEFAAARPDFWGEESPENIERREKEIKSLGIEQEKIRWKVRLGIESPSQFERVKKNETEIRAIEAENVRFFPD